MKLKLEKNKNGLTQIDLTLIYYFKFILIDFNIYLKDHFFIQLMKT